jgi:hypothetical protein
MLAIEELARESLEICKALLLEQGELRPFVLVFTEDRERELLDLSPFMEVQGQWESATKLLARKMIIKRLRDTKAQGYIMHIEAWTAHFTKEQLDRLGDNRPRPRDVPERREVILAEYEAVTDAGEVMGGVLGVHFHHQGDEIIFGEETAMQTALSGNFANMLSEARNPDAKF